MTAFRDKMAEYGVSDTDIQTVLGGTLSDASGKIDDPSALTYLQALRIRDRCFPDMGMEELFGRAADRPL